MKPFFHLPALRFVIVQLGLLLCHNGWAAVNFTTTPSVVNNTYDGPITLLVTGLTTGESVVVQKYLDINANGLVDGGDLLVQQFNLTDGQAGMVIGGVTNINVPGDTDATAGQITASINFKNGDFSQSIIGQYLYVLSSPSGHFTALTNLFTVNNTVYAQSFNGSAVNNGTNVPNAVILLFPPPRPGHGLGQSLAGVVANNLGNFSIAMPPGTYSFLASKNNFLYNYPTTPVVTLAGGATLTTNLTLANATASISGRFVDASNNSIGLPGILLSASSTNEVLGVTFADTNGNFTVGVGSGTWKIGGNSGLAVLGYAEPNNSASFNSGATGVAVTFTKASALFYGSVKDTFGNPLPGIAIEAYDNNNDIYDSDGYTGTNGNYVTAAVGGLGSNDTWQVNVDNSSAFTNYNFSQPSFNQEGGLNLAVGTAVPANFTALLATNQITGQVTFNGNAVSNLQLNAFTQDGSNYQSQATTDSNGRYSLNVGNGPWYVGVDCQGGNNSLDDLLGQGNYQCPNGIYVTINNNNGSANFAVQANEPGQIFGYVTDTSDDPIVGVSVYANDNNGDNDSTTTDGSGYYSFNVGSGNWDVTVDCGDLNSLGYQCVNDQNVSIAGDSVEQDFTAQSNESSLQITTSSLPNATNGAFYNLTLQAVGGRSPYSWSIPNYSANPPSNLALSTNGVLSGIPSTTEAVYYFDVVVTDADSQTAEMDGLSLSVVNPQATFVITNTSLPNGNVGASYSAQLGGTGGQPPYTWSLSLGSASPPPGLSLNSSGLISGVPTTNGLFSFKAQASDENSRVTNKVFGIIVNPRPVLSLGFWLTNQFQMRLVGASNQGYTLQASTNLNSTNWTSLFSTNNIKTNSFLLFDPNATNKQRFYRVLIGP